MLMSDSEDSRDNNGRTDVAAIIAAFAIWQTKVI